MNEKMRNYNVIHDLGNAPIKLWNKHVTIEEAAIKQLKEVASMPFVRPHVAAMPDTHWGMGATVGSVIPTVGAVMPAAVGVDIGCGMMAVRTNLPARAIADNESEKTGIFNVISETIPHGRSNNGGEGDCGAWGVVPVDVRKVWDEMIDSVTTQNVLSRHPGALSKNAYKQLGTLGTGNHFIEVCREIADPVEGNVWIVIHSGSRGFGNRIGTYFTKLAGELCKKWQIKLPNKDLGYLPFGTNEYADYVHLLAKAQDFAWCNRELMMTKILKALGVVIDPEVDLEVPVMIHMHHNYAQSTKINGADAVLTRKGAVDATKGKWVIIPGSMGAKTYLAQGLGNAESFHSCSHGAGRAMSRTEAVKRFTVEDHVKATSGVVCDKTRSVLDETPGAYKDIDSVMESQRDLVVPRLALTQLICVKGLSD